MAASDDVEAGLFHHPHIAPHGFFRHGIAPSGLVLMHVGPVEKEMFPVQEETFVRRPFEPSEAKIRFLAVYQLPSLVKFAHQGI